MKGFPRIQTTRLLLRPFSLHDLEPLHQLWADPDVRRYLWDDDTIAREQVVSEIRKSIIDFRKHRFGQWAVLPLGQETLIGFCGLRHFGDPGRLNCYAPLQWLTGDRAWLQKPPRRCSAMALKKFISVAS